MTQKALKNSWKVPEKLLQIPNKLTENPQKALNELQKSHKAPKKSLRKLTAQKSLKRFLMQSQVL